MNLPATHTNPLPLSQARDADLRLSLPALRRAAQRARELAARTGTDPQRPDKGKKPASDHPGAPGAAARDA